MNKNIVLFLFIGLFFLWTAPVAQAKCSKSGSGPSVSSVSGIETRQRSDGYQKVEDYTKAVHSDGRTFEGERSSEIFPPGRQVEEQNVKAGTPNGDVWGEGSKDTYHPGYEKYPDRQGGEAAPFDWETGKPKEFDPKKWEASDENCPEEEEAKSSDEDKDTWKRQVWRGNISFQEQCETSGEAYRATTALSTHYTVELQSEAAYAVSQANLAEVKRVLNSSQMDAATRETLNSLSAQLEQAKDSMPANAEEILEKNTDAQGINRAYYSKKGSMNYQLSENYNGSDRTVRLWGSGVASPIPTLTLTLPEGINGRSYELSFESPDLSFIEEETPTGGSTSQREGTTNGPGLSYESGRRNPNSKTITGQVSWPIRDNQIENPGSPGEFVNLVGHYSCQTGSAQAHWSLTLVEAE